MTTDKNGQSGAPLTSCENEDSCVACEVCLKEIPGSVAHSHEGEDYVHHFCGLNCLDAWHKRAGKPSPGNQ